MIVIHAFYWFAASFYIGPRYWFMAFFPLIFLSARGFGTVTARLAAAGLDPDGRRSTACLLVLCLFSTAVFLSYRGVTRYYNHRDYNDHYRLLELPATSGTTRPLVLVKPERHMASASFHNDPWFPPGLPVFAEDLGPEANAGVIAAFPRRPVIYYDEVRETFRVP